MARKRRRHSKNKNKDIYISQSTLTGSYGLTKKMIDRYFPEPMLRFNPNYSSSAPMRVWTREQLNEALQNPNLQRALLQKREKAIKKQEKEQREREEMISFLTLFDIEQYRIKAEMMERRFILHVGPTNSGKTYDALQALKAAGKGAYLGPLRLLALEMFDTLNEQGYLTELLTGEEYVEIPGARITSSTIELANYGEAYDVAVIDEAQMIADPQRGDKWTRAIYLLNAKEIHLCLAPVAENVICEILDSFGAPYDILYHDRLAPLEFSGLFNDTREAQPGDALICFSRRAVLATAAELQDYGLNASVIYGALPPVSRREEVRKFSTGENTIVVATDAIGMGISLPIKRIIFLETTKFDGVDMRPLKVGEIKQIAGRAGRYGIYDKGEVLTMNYEGRIRRALEEDEDALEAITIPFPSESLDTDFPLMKLLNEWQELESSPGYRRADMSDAIFLLKNLGGYANQFTKELLFKMITCPVDIKDSTLVAYWQDSVKKIGAGEKPDLPRFDTDSLEGCELQYKALDTRHQLLRSLGYEEDCMDEKMELCKKINQFLIENKDQYLRRCRYCGRPLPATFGFNVCDKCFRRNRGGRG